MPVSELSRVILTGARRSRRRVPRQLRPTRIVEQYTRELRAYVVRVHDAWRPALDEVPVLVSRVRAERRDAGEAERLRVLIAEAGRRLGQSLDTAGIERLARTFAIRTAVFNRQQLRRQALSVLGVDPFVDDQRLRETMDRFVVENTQLIRDVPVSVHRGVKQTVTRGVSSGTLHRDLAKQINAEFAFGRKRASVIARDQIGKFYGQVNAERQKAIGVRRFIWRTVNDIRVRGTPGGPFTGDHYQRDGQIYTYRNPPDGELPGEPIQCRCYAEPYFEDLL